MMTVNHLTPNTQSGSQYDALVHTAHAQRAAALRAGLRKIGTLLGHLAASIGYAKEQSRGLAGARF